MKKTKKVVIITGPGFEDPEVIYPYYRLQEEGYIVDVVTSNDSIVYGKHGIPMTPTIKILNLETDFYAGVILPGGNEAPDRVRQVKDILSFVKKMYERGKIVSSICHGPWILISAGIIKGKNATCYKGMKDDLINAGANYQEAPVVIDKNIITSDHPRNLGTWMKTTIELLKK